MNRADWAGTASLKPGRGHAGRSLSCAPSIGAGLRCQAGAIRLAIEELQARRPVDR